MKSVIQTYNKYLNSLYDFCHTKITSVALGIEVTRSGKLIKTLQLFLPLLVFLKKASRRCCVLSVGIAAGQRHQQQNY